MSEQAKTKPSTFQRFVLSPKDELSGSIINSSQLAVLHNMRTDIAEQKLNLPFTPSDVLGYTQQEAFLSGQLAILSTLIDRSEESQRLASSPSSPINNQQY
jgi:hypothetical protein